MGAERMPGLVLASSSPRRRELLSRLGVSFTIVVPEVDEAVLPGESPTDHVQRLARSKALAVAGPLTAGLVIGADTVVVLDGRIIGKPRDRKDAEAMLGGLAGRTHRVYSGIAVADAASEEVHVDVACSRVTIRPIGTNEIRRYIASGEPLDKAGAYAVQGEGGRYVTGVEGSLTNVIGLPLEELRTLLRRAGLVLPRPAGPL